MTNAASVYADQVHQGLHSAEKSRRVNCTVTSGLFDRLDWRSRMTPPFGPTSHRMGHEQETRRPAVFRPSKCQVDGRERSRIAWQIWLASSEHDLPSWDRPPNKPASSAQGHGVASTNRGLYRFVASTCRATQSLLFATR